MLKMFLTLSIVLNLLLAWYVVQLLKRFLQISEELDEFFDSLIEFSEHLEIVNNMETYYGDATLQNLVRHSKDVVTISKEIRAMYDVDYEPQEDEDEEME